MDAAKLTLFMRFHTSLGKLGLKFSALHLTTNRHTSLPSPLCTSLHLKSTQPKCISFQHIKNHAFNCAIWQVSTSHIFTHQINNWRIAGHHNIVPPATAKQHFPELTVLEASVHRLYQTLSNRTRLRHPNEQKSWMCMRCETLPEILESLAIWVLEQLVCWRR